MSEAAGTLDLGDIKCISINGHEVCQVWCVANAKTDSSHIPVQKIEGCSIIHLAPSRKFSLWLFALVNEVVPKARVESAIKSIARELKHGMVKLRGKHKRMTRIIDEKGDFLPVQVTITLASGAELDVLSRLGAHGVVRLIATRTSMCALALDI